MKYAEKLDDFVLAFQENSLQGTDFDNFYVDTSLPRGCDIVKELVYFYRNKTYNKKVLFCGHLGCGKTTELYRAKKLLSNDYLVLTISVRNETDFNNLEYVDLLFIILDKIVETAKENAINVDENIVDQLYSYWYSEKYKEYINNECYEVNGKIETKAKLGFVASILANIKASFEVGSQLRETTKETIARDIVHVVNSTNQIIKNINEQLSLQHKKLLVIIDDLEKLRTEICQNIFIDNRSVVVSLDLDIIFTFPVSYYYSKYFAEISADFDGEMLLSMIKTHHKNGEDYNQGIDCLTNLVKKRCNTNLFEYGVLEFLIKKSGGSIRDLFILIERSAIRARSLLDSSTITMDIAKYEFNCLVSSKQRSLRKEQIDYLIYLYHDKYKKPLENENEDLLSLLQSMNIIEYNGDRWCDLHPATLEYLKNCEYIE